MAFGFGKKAEGSPMADLDSQKKQLADERKALEKKAAGSTMGQKFADSFGQGDRFTADNDALEDYSEQLADLAEREAALNEQIAAAEAQQVEQNKLDAERKRLEKVAKGPGLGSKFLDSFGVGKRWEKEMAKLEAEDALKELPEKAANLEKKKLRDEMFEDLIALGKDANNGVEVANQEFQKIVNEISGRDMLEVDQEAVAQAQEEAQQESEELLNDFEAEVAEVKNEDDGVDDKTGIEKINGGATGVEIDPGYVEDLKAAREDTEDSPDTIPEATSFEEVVETLDPSKAFEVDGWSKPMQRNQIQAVVSESDWQQYQEVFSGVLDEERVKAGTQLIPETRRKNILAKTRRRYLKARGGVSGSAAISGATLEREANPDTVPEMSAAEEAADTIPEVVAEVAPDTIPEVAVEEAPDTIPEVAEEAPDTVSEVADSQEDMMSAPLSGVDEAGELPDDVEEDVPEVVEVPKVVNAPDVVPAAETPPVLEVVEDDAEEVGELPDDIDDEPEVEAEEPKAEKPASVEKLSPLAEQGKSIVEDLQALGASIKDFEKIHKNGKFESIDMLDMVDNSMSKLDPTGKSEFVDKDLFERMVAFVQEAAGVEVLYPEPNGPYKSKDYEMAGVETGTGLPERTIVRIVNPGYKYGNGNVRKPRVIVAD